MRKLLFCLCLFFCWALQTCDALTRATYLPAGFEVEQVSPGLEGHHYRFEGISGHLEEIEVLQCNGDMRLIVTDPSGRTLFDWDGPFGHIGREIVCFKVPVSGLYRITVKAFSVDEKGAYRITRRSSMDSGNAHLRLQAFSKVAEAVRSENTPHALLCLSQANLAWRNVGDLEQAALTSWRRANIFKGLLEINHEIECFLEVIQTLEQTDQILLKAMAIYYLADAQNRAGFIDEAIASYQKALGAFKAKDRNRADILESLGKTYLFAGNLDRAGPYLEEAFAIQKLEGNREDLASICAGKGWLFHRAGDLKGAQEYYREGLSFAGEEFPREKFKLLQYQAQTWRALGEYEKALASMDEAAQSIKMDRISQAFLDLNRGALYIDMKRFDEAQKKVLDALPALDQKPMERAHAYFCLALVAQASAQPAKAKRLIEQTLEVINKVGMTGLSSEMRAQFRASRSAYFGLLLDLSVELEPEPALQAFSLAATRNSQLLYNTLEQPLDAENMTPLKQLHQLGNQISALAWHELEASSAENQIRMGFMIEHYQKLWDQTHILSPSFQNRDIGIQDVISALPDDETTLLFFAMGLDYIHIWMINRQLVKKIVLPDRSRIADIALDLHEMFRNGSAQNSKERASFLSQTLSDCIFKDFWPRLNGRRLWIVPDGALCYVPFTSLPSPLEVGSGNKLACLAQRFEITVFPSLISYQFKPMSTAANQIIILANPTYGNEYVSLPGTLDEAGYIIGHSNNVGLSTHEMLGNLADRSLFLTDPRVEEARYLHFATHGIFMAQCPELSALVLSTKDANDKPVNGYLRVQDIAGMKMKADLVVLSACETALGKEIEGEGLRGFSNAFLKAGARSVLVSLWRVDDVATTHLMDHFYHGLLEQKLPPAKALQRAQLAMSKDPRWHDPYYWAGFIYQSAWPGHE